MVHILKADYETITAECPHCQSTSVYNRVSDIGDVGPYDGRDISCLSCAHNFWINMDTVGPAYQMFIHAADEHFRQKHYMLAIGNLGQAWELFFATYVATVFLYRPFFTGPRDEQSVDELNAVAEELEHAIRKFTFLPLRNLLVHTAIKNIRPRTLAESVTAIARIAIDKLDSTPKQVLLETFPNEQISASLKQLLSLTISELRNKALHKRAYRPNRSETQRCLEEEVTFMFSLKHLFGVGTFEEHHAGVI